LRTDTYGRRFLQRANQRICTGYIRIFYCSRALEWINIRQLFHSVLCLFHFSHLCHILDGIACTHAKRLLGFCDPKTLSETSSFAQASTYVCTTDLRIIQHKQLRDALAYGLNHIPLRPTNIAQTVRTVMTAFDQLVDILDLVHTEFQLLEAR
jgi:uncharacterized membrane protein